MIDSRQMLALYRVAPAHEEQLFDILALLYRDKTLTEYQIADETETDVKEIRILLSRLYRSRFVELKEADRYANSALARELMKRAGVPGIAAEWYLRSFRSTTKEDLEFFKICRVVEEEHNELDTLDQLVGMLRILRQSQMSVQRLDLEIKEFAEVQRRVLFAIAVGLNPRFEVLGPNRYCDYILGSHFDKKSRGERKTANQLQITRDYEKSCRLALSDIERSNTVLYSGIFHRKESEDADVVYWVTLTRVLAALVDGNADLQLRFFLSEKDSIERVWKTLARVAPESIDIAWQLLNAHQRRIIEDSFSFRLSRLVDILRENLNRLKGIGVPLLQAVAVRDEEIPASASPEQDTKPETS